MSKRGIVWHNLSTVKVLQTLKTSHQGLTEEEAKKRRKSYGFNVLADKRKFSTWRLFLSQFKSALVYVLVIAGFISLAFGELIDFYVIFTAVFLNVIIGFTQERKANQSLEKLSKVVKQEAIVLRQGRETKIEAKDLVPGDIIILQAGDRVPVDARVLSADRLKINEAPLTGEPWPEKKNTEVLAKGTFLGDRTNMVFMGTLVVTGRGEAVVTTTGIRTEVGQITKMLRDTIEDKTPLQKKLDIFAKNLTSIIIAIAFLIFFLGIMRGETYLEMFTIAVALAVSAIPEGLVIGVTMILTIGMQRILKNNGLVRKLISAETLGSTTLICTDKTGTVTEGEMRVTNIMTSHNQFSLTEGSIKDIDFDNEVKRLMEIAIACNDAAIQNINTAREDWQIIGSPTEKALLLFGSLDLSVKSVYKRYFKKQEVPFDSSYKYMVTRHSFDSKRDIVFVKGAPEKILEFSSYYFSNIRNIKLTAAKRETFVKGWQEFSKDGLRVLGAGFKLIPRKYKELENCEPSKDCGLVFVGFWGLEDPLRKEAKETLTQALAAGIKTIVITGDNQFTAKKVASNLGFKIDSESIVTGQDLLKMSDTQLEERITKIQIYARVTPADKLRIIKAWQKRGEVVSMTGDGVNDAPALKAADIGVVVSSGSDVAKEVADLVLLDNNFKTIVMAIRQGRVIFDNVRKIILYLLSDSFSEIIIIFVAMLLGWPLPLITAQILWINLVSDGLPNLALTMEPEDPEIMKDKNIREKKSLFGFESKFLIAVISLVTGLASLLIFYYFWKQTGDVALARTTVFTALGLDTLLYVFSIRSLEHSIFTTNPFKNMYLNLAVLFGIMLQLSAIYLPVFNKALRTVPLAWEEWKVILVFLVGVIFIIEVIKTVFIFYQRRATSQLGKLTPEAKAEAKAKEEEEKIIE